MTGASGTVYVSSPSKSGGCSAGIGSLAVMLLLFMRRRTHKLKINPAAHIRVAGFFKFKNFLKGVLQNEKNFILAILAVALAASAAHAGMAPLSPEFLKWKEQQHASTIRVAGDNASARNYGVRPLPLNLAHLAGNPAQMTASELPEKFDLRTLGVVPPLRDQSNWAAPARYKLLGFRKHCGHGD